MPKFDLQNYPTLLQLRWLPLSKLSAVCVLQVPITWENDQPSVSPMLVVPDLSWPTLFGQNHLRMTQAQTDHAEQTVHFRDPALGFTILNVGIQIHYSHFHLCPSFPVQTGQKPESGEHLFTGPGVNVTCLFTAFPPLHSPSDMSYYIKAIT